MIAERFSGCQSSGASGRIADCDDHLLRRRVRPRVRRRGDRAIARAVGTPCYLYSASAIRAAYRAFDHAFARTPHRLHYALKANSTLAVLRLLRQLGSGADANSGGEIEIALRAGLRPDRHRLQRRRQDPDGTRARRRLGVRAINVSRPASSRGSTKSARASGTRARVAVRVNPTSVSRATGHLDRPARDQVRCARPTRSAGSTARSPADRGSSPSSPRPHRSQMLSLDPLREPSR